MLPIRCLRLRYVGRQIILQGKKKKKKVWEDIDGQGYLSIAPSPNSNEHYTIQGPLQRPHTQFTLSFRIIFPTNASMQEAILVEA